MNSVQPKSYDAVDMENNKTFIFRNHEIYPSIKPPVPRCQPESSRAVEDSGNGLLDSQVAKFTQMGVDNPCNTRRYVSNKGKLPPRELDCSTLSPYDAMRMINCNTAKFRQWERYPSIRSPISKCSSAQTAEWLANAVEDNGCGRLFDMGFDDIVEVWKRSPNKDSLGYYGIGSAIHTPEAVVFNQVLSKCLDEVNPPKPITEKAKPALPESQKYPMKPSGAFVLNRQMLKGKVKQMPTVNETLRASNALKWLHCPRSFKNEQPFVKSEPHVSLEADFETERLFSKPKHGLRRKYKYCELQCDIPSNQCTDYEWHKYKQDPKPYEVAFQKELEELETEMAEEPKNYDELYSQLITCFEKDTSKDPLSGAYKCCIKAFKPSDSGDDGMGDGDGRGPGKRGAHGTGVGKGDGQGGAGDGKGGGGAGTGADDGHGGDGNKHHGDGFGSEGGKKTGKTKDKSKKTTKTGRKPKPAKSLLDDQMDSRNPAPKFSITSRDSPREAARDIDSIDHSSSSESKKKKKGTPKTDKKKKKKIPKKTKDPKAKPEHSCSTNKKGEKPFKDCPCNICDLMNRSKKETVSPAILQMTQDQKQGELRDYYKRMCHQNYLKWRKPNYPAPQHKCDPIKCDNIFCSNPKIAEYCDCLNAMNHLQKLLGPKHCIVDNQILFDVNDLKNRICRRLCESV